MIRASHTTVCLLCNVAFVALLSVNTAQSLVYTHTCFSGECGIVTYIRQVSPHRLSRVSSFSSLPVCGIFSCVTTSSSQVVAWVLLWYGVSVSMVMANRWLFHDWNSTGFQFPILTTMIHMWLKVVVCKIVLYWCCCQVCVVFCSKFYRCIPNSAPRTFV